MQLSSGTGMAMDLDGNPLWMVSVHRSLGFWVFINLNYFQFTPPELSAGAQQGAVRLNDGLVFIANFGDIWGLNPNTVRDANLFTVCR